MKFHNLTILIFILLSFACIDTNATVISGSHTYGGGSVVDLSGLEWMSLDETGGDAGQLDRNGMKAAFSDSSSQFFGWRYASRSETAALLGSLSGGVDGWDVSNYQGTDWFFDNFGVGPAYASSLNEGYAGSGYNMWNFAYGDTAECYADPQYGCHGYVQISSVERGAPSNNAFISSFYGASATSTSSQVLVNDTPTYQSLGANNSHLLVRGSSVVRVSSPSTLLLFLLFGLPMTFVCRITQKV